MPRLDRNPALPRAQQRQQVLLVAFVGQAVVDDRPGELAWMRVVGVGQQLGDPERGLRQRREVDPGGWSTLLLGDGETQQRAAGPIQALIIYAGRAHAPAQAAT